MRKAAIITATIALTVGCGQIKDDVVERPSSSRSFVATGYVDLTGEGVTYEGSGRKGEVCWGQEDVADIEAGTKVLVRDSDGSLVGRGELSLGKIMMPKTVCRFTFEVNAIPAEAGPYTVGLPHRGRVAFSQSGAHDLGLELDD